MSVVRLVVATRSSGPPASGKIIKEMSGSVASGTPYRTNVSVCLTIYVRTHGVTAERTLMECGVGELY